MNDFFLLKRKIGERLNVYDMRLTTAAKNCFKNPKGEDVYHYKKIKIIEEIDEEIKEQLKYSTVLMDEELNYEQLIEALTKLEEIKNEKEQETKILKAGVMGKVFIDRLVITFPPMRASDFCRAINQPIFHKNQVLLKD